MIAEDRTSEDATGIGIDRGGVREIRAHCEYQWEDMLTISPSGRHWKVYLQLAQEMPEDSIMLDSTRLRTLGHALLEAAGEA